MNEVIQHIPLDKLVPSKGNRHVGGFDEARLAQLADSIASIGVQQPAIVRLRGDVYEIVAGERRWRASRLAGVPTLPCIVKELDDAAALHIQLIENLQREDIHPLDEADGFSRLIEEGHYEIEYIAKELGRSAVYVYQRLRLRKLIPGARSQLASGKLSIGHANLIARLPAKQQKEALDLLGRLWEPSVKDFDERLRRDILMELSRASWKLDDEKLLPTAGVCTSCPKRTGAEPQLFAELGKKDCCTDRACFEAKEKALIERRQAELEGIKHLEVRDGYSGDTNANALAPYEWVECKKKDEGAVRVLVVGGDHPGRLTYGKLRSATKMPAEKKEEKHHEKAIKAAALELRGRLFDGLALSTVSGISDLLLIEATKEAWRQMAWDTKRLLAQRLEFEKRPKKYGDDGYEGAFQDWIIGKDRADLETMRIMILYAGNMFIPGNCYLRLDDSFRAVAAVVGIDVKKEIDTIAAARKLSPDEIDVPKRDTMYGQDDDAEDEPDLEIAGTEN